MSRKTEPYATCKDLAEEYGIEVITVQRRARDGKWPAGKIGNRYRFSPEQQEEIAQIVSGKRDSGYDKNRIAEALRKLSA